MSKIQVLIVSIIFTIVAPQVALALQMPQSGNDLATMFGVNAQAYAVADTETGQILVSKNPDVARVPASLTKLVTALVVLDTKPKLTKVIAMTQADQVVGGCSNGGACIKSKAGVKFTVDGLFHAMLMPSANNAAAALARSTGLSMDDFASRMNQKAAALGATQTKFNETTGMDAGNMTTASDYTKIVTAAFSNSYLRTVAGLQSYYLKSTNNSRYNQTIKNTDKLLSDGEIRVLGAKTGYLDEAGYNFAALVKQDGHELAVVVLGEQHLYTAFAETKLLAGIGKLAKDLALQAMPPTVLGATTFTPAY